eukprot:scaffold12199_cov92-Skeletonema_dohrnii-CCMP3373.AAC.1
MFRFVSVPKGALAKRCPLVIGTAATTIWWLAIKIANTPQILFFGVVNIAEWGGIHGAQGTKLITEKSTPLSSITRPIVEQSCQASRARAFIDLRSRSLSPRASSCKLLCGQQPPSL